MRDLRDDEKSTLEALVDAAGLQTVLMALSEICGDKAAHVEYTWHDRALAHEWRTHEGTIGCLSTKVHNL